MQIYLPIAELSMNLFFLVGIGGAVGFLSGLFGVGGGFLLTPLLIFSGVPSPVAVPAAAPRVSVEIAEATEPPAPTHAAKPTSNLRLEDEAALLAEVQGALRAGQASVALAKLEGYDRRFPGGMLRPEAEAARVFALCAAGKVERARTAATRFAQRYPSSPALARVQAACK